MRPLRTTYLVCKQLYNVADHRKKGKKNGTPKYREILGKLL